MVLVNSGRLTIITKKFIKHNREHKRKSQVDAVWETQLVTAGFEDERGLAPSQVMQTSWEAGKSQKEVVFRKPAALLTLQFQSSETPFGLLTFK